MLPELLTVLWQSFNTADAYKTVMRHCFPKRGSRRTEDTFLLPHFTTVNIIYSVNINKQNPERGRGPNPLKTENRNHLQT